MSALGDKLISHVIQHGSLSFVVAAGIKPVYLQGGARKAFEYLLGLTRPPSEAEVTSQFGVKVDSVSAADLPFLIEQLKKRFVTNECKPLIEQAIQAFEGRDPMEALDLMDAAVQHRAVLMSEGPGVHRYKADAEERVHDYVDVRDAGGLLGIKSMWPSVNKATGGWAKGWFYSIIGFTSIGKSWGLCIIADDMTKQIGPDDCILMVTTEMGSRRLARRVDCVKFELPFGDLRDGDLDQVDEDRWAGEVKKAMQGKAPYGEIVFVSKKDVRTVDDVLMYVARHKPLAVLIDGGYRLYASDDGWGGQVEIIRKIQKGAEDTNVPWIVTSQLGTKDEKGKSRLADTQNLWNVRYAREWSIDPDVVLLMSQTEDMFLMQEMGWDFAKIRDADGPKIKFRTNWNRNTIDFSEKPVVATGTAGTTVSYA